MSDCFLYSIGHGNKTKERLLEDIKKFGIRYLVDVRSVPYSKFYPHFNREELMHFINEQENLQYVYMGDQIGGLPKDDSLKTDGKMDYDKMKKSPLFVAGLNRLLKANELQLPTCVLCSESNPAECHRSKLIGEALRDHGVIMQHICHNHYDVTILKSQIEVINEATGGLTDLFQGTITLTSRNTYQ